MLYLIGLGLNEKGYSREAYDSISKADRIYFDSYTVDFPYKIKDLEKQFYKKKFLPADRELIESFGILDEAKNKKIVLLVYGSPLTATTHISLIQEAKKRKIKYRVIHGASVLDAVLETGLQVYKFGKIASMPSWIPEKNFKPESFAEIIKENQSIEAHTLLLIDIGLGFQEALNQLEAVSLNQNVALKKIIVCQSLGTKNRKIFYGEIEELKDKKIKKPFCIIIPGKLHFVEKDFLESLR